MGNNFEVGEYIIYVCSDRYEIGRVKSLREDGAFVCYHEGETAAKTPYNLMHKLENGYCIKKSTLGGSAMMEEPKRETIDKSEKDNYMKAKSWVNSLSGMVFTSPLPLPLHVYAKMSNNELVDFLTEQFAVSRTTAKGMLHILMQCKAEDNFKKQFSGRRKEDED